jgi:tRNA-specific adenosine deaminase 3
MGPTAAELPAPELLEEFGALVPYVTVVPALPALTPGSLQAKLSIWPTVYSPRRKGEPETWSVGKMRWATRAIMMLAHEARGAQAKGEV